MITPPQILVEFLLGSSVALSVAFFIYGLNMLHLTVRSRRYSEPALPKVNHRPSVAIHLPIYNEVYVVERLLRACASVAKCYGKERTGIYVIDDSTDETSNRVGELAAGLRSEGLRTQVIRRGNRQGFKAGALQAALERTQEEFVAIFDADFVPAEDFLQRTVPYLAEDETVGFVQARWGHLDRGYDSVTRSIAVGVDAHFLIEQKGRTSSDYFMSFNGSAGVIRADALRKAGGWNSDTLAEDLDASYRIQLAGYRGVYLSGVEVPGELPPTISSLKRQQGRWARGSLQTAKKLLPSVIRSKTLSLRQKVEAAVHLTYYLVHPLMVASFLLAVAATLLNVDVIRYAVKFSIPSYFARSAGQGITSANVVTFTVQLAPWVVFSVLVVLSTIAVLYYCVEAIRVQNLGLLRNVKEIVLLVILGYGISISNSVQAVSGLLSGSSGTFMRTPKYAITDAAHTWQEKKYQLPLNTTNLLEAAAVLLAAVATGEALATQNFGILPILLIYFLGFACVWGMTLRQALASSGRGDA